MKRILVGLLAIVCGLTAVGIYMTRDVQATHPVLRASDLPPLIPTRAFYADPRSEFGFIASHDGAYTISEKATLAGPNFVVREVASGKQIAEFPDGLSGIRWHPNKPLIRFIFRGNDWEADPKNPDQKNWVRTTPIQLSGGWALGRFATNPEQRILFWGRTNQTEPSHMWLVSQDGREAEKIATGNSETQYWVVDEQDVPRLRVDALDTATKRMYRKDGDDWIALIDLDLNDTFQPLSKVDKNGTILARSSRNRDKVALVRFDIQTGDETVLLENPDGDIALTTALTFDGPPDIIRMGFDSLERVALTERGHVFLDVLEEFPQPLTLGFTSATPSGRYVTQAISPQNQSWIYLLIDLQEATYKILGEYHFRRFKNDLVEGSAIKFKARDGLDIPAILTVPKNASGPIPFIIDIHGGPADEIPLGYDHQVQFLVNRGYGVLSVNFRGSIGFGKEFQAAGFKQFGRAMQDDIADAANWLVDQKLADPEALIAMGSSYGGYSAALAMMRDPGLFDAAIVEFPMLDVEFQTKYHPGFWEQRMHEWWRYFGKLDNEDDLAFMRQYSPSNLIDQLHGPLLVLAGVRDDITTVEQVRDFEAKALEAEKDVEVYYFADAGHGVSRWRDELRRARLIEDFLAEQVGGRSGGFELVEWAPEFID